MDDFEKGVKIGTGALGVIGGFCADIVVTQGLNMILPGAGTLVGKAVQAIGKHTAGVAVGYAFCRYTQEMGENILKQKKLFDEIMKDQPKKVKVTKVSKRKAEKLKKEMKAA